ncbi:peptidylprolyl isomerase [archaeon CG07_land_8_20_14_0_80_38_8]|nr:MAG: peptidylprolyl isomerase [archaeon CG07_land_8_20_14_0_80_38_8]PIU89278.1 MAG: peptidylprolyl isomerase [archaeon CG06_land_8_20_14_3_00_37_11]
MIKENDCVKINYNAYVKESKSLFDTTSEAVAKEMGIYQQGNEYEPIRVIVGRGFVVKGLDKSLENREAGGKYEIIVPASEGFGDWTNKLTENIKMKSFRDKGINPETGMLINVDNKIGRVMFVSRGRFAKLDYNHPLAGKDLIYDVEILEILEKPEDKVNTIVYSLLGKQAKISFEEKNIGIKTAAEIPENLKKAVEELVKETLKKGYTLSFIVK